ncbi:MAG: DEAD/DEAH box helicase [Acholeplasmatales bacterium]|nr:DEAD/DEAH box helicase [Acholeplasmatales bacterium]
MEKILFNEMNIQVGLKKAIELLGFTTPTDIQNEAIPKALEGFDLVGEAKTGTGKTFSFAIPMIEKIDTKNNNIQGLVMLPTRELALQVYAEYVKLLKFNRDVKVTTIYGGQSYDKQLKDLKAKPHIVIGTPGRIIDHMNRGTLNFTNLKMLVLDEADEMLKMGFIDDIEFILANTPNNRQTLLFSATMPEEIRKVSKKYLNNPINIKIGAKTLTVDQTKQYYYEVKQSSKTDLLIRLIDFYSFNSAIIFCNTKSMVDELTSALQQHDYAADAIHGDLKQVQRDRVMNSFRNGLTKILIATDVAARGIDVKGVEAVFNYDLPQDDESYVHRIGRTGRAGLSGVSLSFVTGRGRNRISEIERFTKSKMEKKEIPSIDEIIKQKQKKIYSDITMIIDSSEKKNTYKPIINKLLAEGYDGIDILNALLDKIVKDEIKEYKEIEIEEPYKRKNKDSKKHNRTDAKGKEISYSYYQINLGRNDGVRPKELVEFLSKLTKIPNYCFGDIIIHNNKTSFEIRPDMNKKIVQIQGRKVNGFELSLRKLSKLE